ncbi:MAG: hypothetical protein NTY80_01925 [candidate division SR1 bacterium]|nr:hypothetical protein [candidate division SR1 bacterium]
MTNPANKKNSGDSKKIVVRDIKQNINNKKIYFDSDGTEIKIGYDEETGVGFVEIIGK